MAANRTFETVTGYCWPQSAVAGEHGRAAPVVGRGPDRCRSRSPGSAPSARSCSRSVAVPADDHATPADACGARLRLAGRQRADRRSGWRSGYYEVVLRSTSTARPAAATRSSSCGRSPGRASADPAGARHQHLARVQRLRRPQPLHRRDAGVAAAADGARLPVQAAGPRPAGHVDRTRPTRRWRPTSAYLTLNHLSPWAGSAGWPDWELPFVRWAEREGYDVRRRHQRRPRGPPRAARRRRRPLPAVPVGRPRRVLVGPDARHRRGLHRPRRQRRVPLGQHRRSGRCASRTRHAGGPGRDHGRLQGLVQAATRCSAPTGRPSSRASGPTTSSAAPRTT